MHDATDSHAGETWHTLHVWCIAWHTLHVWCIITWYELGLGLYVLRHTMSMQELALGPEEAPALDLTAFDPDGLYASR